MMPTLLTHEWKRAAKPLLTATGIAVLMTAVGSAAAAIGWPIVSLLGAILAIAVTILYVPGIQVLLAVDYWLSSYSRTGYFTQTLPVRGGTIFSAKLLFGFAVTVAGLLVTLVLGALAWMGQAIMVGENANPFRAAGNFWALIVDAASPGIIAVGLGLLLLSYAVWLVQMYFSVSIGSESRFNRMGLGGPILVFICLYVAMQILLAVSILTVPLGIGPVADGLGFVRIDLLGEVLADPTSSGGDLLPLGFIPPLVLVTVLCLWRTARSWNRHVSLV